MPLTEEEKAEAFELNNSQFESMKLNFIFLLDKFQDEARYDSFTRFNDPTLPRRIREEFWVTRFFERLDNLYERFLSLQPKFGDDRESFVANTRPILDGYFQLREEFYANMIIT
jgi:hypothetical protein